MIEQVDDSRPFGFKSDYWFYHNLGSILVRAALGVGMRGDDADVGQWKNNGRERARPLGLTLLNEDESTPTGMTVSALVASAGGDPITDVEFDTGSGRLLGEFAGISARFSALAAGVSIDFLP